MNGHLRQRSAGSFELRYRSAGKVRTETFRGTKKAAQARLRELLVAVDRGVDIEPRKITIAQLVRERIALWRSERRITARTEESYATMAKLIDASLGHVALPRLTTRQIEQWHQTLRARGLSAATIRKANALLGHALADAQRHNLVARNVAREQGAPRAPASRIKVLTVDRIAPLLEALRGSEFHAPAILAIYGGARRGELLSLRWSDFDGATSARGSRHADQHQGAQDARRCPQGLSARGGGRSVARAPAADARDAHGARHGQDAR